MKTRETQEQKEAQGGAKSEVQGGAKSEVQSGGQGKEQSARSKGLRRKSAEEKGSLFLRLFEKYDIRNEAEFSRFGKWVIFIVLVLVETFILLQHFDLMTAVNLPKLFAIIIVETVLTASEAVKLFVLKSGKVRMSFFVFDVLLAGTFVFLTSGTYAIVAYILVLTEFYFETEKTRASVVMLCLAAPTYAATYVLNEWVLAGQVIDVYACITQSFSHIVALTVHFFAIQIALAFYRQFLRLDKALTELDESKKELEKAYAVVAEVTALEERQRIAKEIHDTAGHSLTTVIMQTEAAKLIVLSNPEEAKNKLVAANLQAKHALEELRDSVHLLSGVGGENTLKNALEGIIHESMDGTGITIRSQIAEIEVYPAKFRFLCNTLKEGISNGLRHGGATAFWFELKEENGKIEFLLSDNGKGVAISALTKGFGLTSMQDRAKALGGKVCFLSEPGEGFELRLTLPTDIPANGK